MWCPLFLCRGHEGRAGATAAPHMAPAAAERGSHGRGAHSGTSQGAHPCVRGPRGSPLSPALPYGPSWELTAAKRHSGLCKGPAQGLGHGGRGTGPYFLTARQDLACSPTWARACSPSPRPTWSQPAVLRVEAGGLPSQLLISREGLYPHPSAHVQLSSYPLAPMCPPHCSQPPALLTRIRGHLNPVSQ